ITGEKPDSRQQQQTGVNLPAAIRLHESASLGIETVGANVGADLVANTAPAVQWTAEAESFSTLDTAVDSNPRHHIGIGEMTCWTAHLPHTLIGLSPCLFEMLEHGDLQRPARIAACQSAAARLMQGIHHFAVDVELQLAVRGIANPHRA